MDLCIIFVLFCLFKVVEDTLFYYFHGKFGHIIHVYLIDIKCRTYYSRIRCSVPYHTLWVLGLFLVAILDFSIQHSLVAITVYLIICNLKQEQGLPRSYPWERWRCPTALCSHLWLPEHSKPCSKTEKGEVTLSFCRGHGVSIRWDLDSCKSFHCCRSFIR